MDLIESTTCSFIIKVWLEEQTDETGSPIWRGHITHVPSGQRRHLKDLQEAVGFIAYYLAEMGAKFGSSC